MPERRREEGGRREEELLKSLVLTPNSPPRSFPLKVTSGSETSRSLYKPVDAAPRGGCTCSLTCIFVHQPSRVPTPSSRSYSPPDPRTQSTTTGTTTSVFFPTPGSARLTSSNSPTGPSPPATLSANQVIAAVIPLPHVVITLFSPPLTAFQPSSPSVSVKTFSSSAGGSRVE